MALLLAGCASGVPNEPSADLGDPCFASCGLAPPQENPCKVGQCFVALCDDGGGARVCR